MRNILIFVDSMSTTTLLHRSTTGFPARGPRISATGVVATVAVHVAVVTATIVTSYVSMEPASSNSLMVEIIPAAPAQTPARRQPSKEPPKVMAPRRHAAPLPANLPQDQRTAIAGTPAVTQEATPPAPAALPISSPRFDAAYLSNPAPVYPALSRRLGEEGKVVLRALVEPEGRSGQIEIRSSSGSPRLDQAAVEAVRRWKFIPARRGDETVAAWVLIPIVFNLRD